MKTLVVVPAYNEATTIESVLQALHGMHDVVVIDDGSTDDTGVRARACGVRVLSHVVNRGLGAALRTGFAYALRVGEYDAVVTLDADGQHDPNDIPRVLAGLSGGSDVVIGARVRSDMPPIRQAYNMIGGVISAGLFGGPMIDAQSGFRAFKITKLREMNLTTSRMEISSEIVAEAHRIGARIVEVPISVRYTTYSLSKGQSFLEGVRTLWRLVLKSLN